MMNTEVRKAENYKIVNSIHIGDKEIVLGIDMKNPDGHYYMVGDYDRNELFEMYNNVFVSSDYIEIAEIYSNRLKDQIEKVKTAEKDMPRVLERPKVLYNEATKKFVMWMHLDNADYTYASAGVAISDSPLGPFKLLRVMQPNRQDVRDMTVFKDENGKAYMIHSKDWNKTLNIAELTDDYTDVNGFYVSVMLDQEREAPAVFKRNGTYYMITSGCTGWYPNAALYAQCKHIMGQWKLIDNPCIGELKQHTFGGQSSYVFEKNGTFYLMLDHWQPDNLQNLGYSILPIKFDIYDNMIIEWTDDWQEI